MRLRNSKIVATGSLNQECFRLPLPSANFHGTNQKLANLKRLLGDEHATPAHDFFGSSSWSTGLSLVQHAVKKLLCPVGFVGKSCLITVEYFSTYTRSREYSSVVEHLHSICKVSLTELLNQKRSRTGKKIMCYSGLKSLWSVSFQDNKFLVHCHPKLTITFLLNASFNRAKHIDHLELFRLTIHKHYRISSETLN